MPPLYAAPTFPEAEVAIATLSAPPGEDAAPPVKMLTRVSSQQIIALKRILPKMGDALRGAMPTPLSSRRRHGAAGAAAAMRILTAASRAICDAISRRRASELSCYYWLSSAWCHDELRSRGAAPDARYAARHGGFR